MPRHLWHRSFQNNDYLIMSPPATASSPNMLMDRTFFIPLVILSRILETQTNTSFHAMEPHVKNKATRSPPHTRCEFHSISFAFCCIYWGDTGEQGYTGVRCIILRHILCALCCVFITPCQVSVHHHYPPIRCELQVLRCIMGWHYHLLGECDPHTRLGVTPPGGSGPGLLT